MNVTIYPSKANGTVWAPPSKSVVHRALLCGALTTGCVVDNVAYSQDVEATIRCLKALGASVQTGEDQIFIGGLDPFAIGHNVALNCGESGSTLRFLLPLCLLSGRTVTLCGSGRLMERPLTVYRDLCQENGVYFNQNNECVTICGCLKPGLYRLPGNVSSQFITGMLYALSLLPGESRLEVVGKFESASYVEITRTVLKEFGVDIQREENAFILTGNSTYKRSHYTVEGDCSNAAFLDAFNLLGGSVKVNGLTGETPQGDRVYRSFFQELRRGCHHFDLSDCPDLGPVMFALAAFCGGAEFTGTARLRLKESDRCAAMAQELAKFGIAINVRENTLTVLPGELCAPTEPLLGHNDHRVVMALSLLCSVKGGTILGADVVAKSYPNYFDVLQSIGIELKTDSF